MKKTIIAKLQQKHILMFILLVASVFRFIGIYPGFNQYHPDEGMSYGAAVEMIKHNDLNPRRFDYPSGVPLFHFLVYKMFVLPVVYSNLIINNPNIILEMISPNFVQSYSEDIFGKGYYGALIWSRYITALLGIVSVFMTYLIGLRLFNRYVGLIAALFISVNYRHVLSSHLALSDIPNSLFMLFAIYSCILLFEKRSFRNYMMCGLFVGLSFSMKYQILALFPFLFVHFHHFLRERSVSVLFHRDFLLSSLLIPFVFLLLNPYLILNLSTAVPVIKYVSLRYGAGVNKFNFYPLFYLYHFGVSYLPFFAIIVGLIITSIKQPVKSIILLCYVIPFLYIFLYYMAGGTYVRNFTTVMPLLFIFAGYGVYFLLTNVTRRIHYAPVAFISIVLVLFLINNNSVYDSAILVRDYTRDWNREELGRWAGDYLPSNVSVRNDNLALDYVKEKNRDIIPLEQRAENSIAEFQEVGDDFAVINLFWNYNLFFWSLGLSPEDLIVYGSIPYEFIDETYAGIALRELLNYTVYEIYKARQAPEFNYFIAKIPKLPLFEGKEIASFSFDKSSQNWRNNNYFSTDNKQDKFMGLDKTVGKKEKGSLLYKGGASDIFSRVESDYIQVKPNISYMIRGFLKTDVVLESGERDGFMRLDFYNSRKEEIDPRKGVTRAVSGRVFGTTDWVEKLISVTSPSDAKYMKIGFQRNFPSRNYSIWLDDVVVKEIKNKLNEKHPELPYIRSTIPNDILYPNSIL